MTIVGAASKEGTLHYIERFPELMEASAFRRFRRLRVSSLGLGTYLGAPTSTDDALYSQSIEKALSSGINVIDTAINYRSMCSERIVGRTLKQLIDAGKIAREEVFISSKGGYLPIDAEYSDPQHYVEDTFFSSGLLQREEAEGILHSLDPKFLRNQLEQSRKNLGLETIDLYYLHNPETQLTRVPRAEFLGMLAEAFQMLEGAVEEGIIGSYGLATWGGFRVDNSAQQFLSLPEIVKAAQKVGGAEHSLSAVQLPLNLSKTEAVSLKNQRSGEKRMSTSRMASDLRIGIFASATLDQGRLTQYLPAVVKQHFRSLRLDSHVAVQFSRSCTGVCSALVGMKTPAHVTEITEILKTQPESPENFVRLFESPDKSIV